MQTFLPYDDFEKSLRYLDTKRLGKQRVEASTLLDGKWPNHPASKMWRGYEPALIRYYNMSIQEWGRRGHENNMRLLWDGSQGDQPEMPWWFGWDEFHYYHKAALMAKMPEHYFFEGVEPEINYVWPLPEIKGVHAMGALFERPGESKIQFSFPWYDSKGRVLRARLNSDIHQALLLARGTTLAIAIDGEIVETYNVAAEMNDLLYYLNRRVGLYWLVNATSIKPHLKLLMAIKVCQDKKLPIDNRVRMWFSNYVERAKRKAK